MMTGGLIVAGPWRALPASASAAGMWIDAALARLAALGGALVMAASRIVEPPSSAARTGQRGRPALSLVAASSPGDGDGTFHAAVLPHLDAAYNLARFLTRDADAADDIVQEAFLRAFRGFDGYRGGDARAWLLAIVRNCARSWASERTRARTLLEPLDPPQAEDGAEMETREIADPDQCTPEAALLRDSEASIIRRLIENLPEAFREVLVLREFDDLSYREIADITTTPIGTVMSRLARARQMLGDAWRRQSGEERP